MNAYGKIRTVQFTPAAPGAPARIDVGRDALIVEPDAFPRAERSADAAGFAPVAKDIYLEALSFVWLRTSGCGRFFFSGLARAPDLAPSSLFTRL